MSDRRGRMLVVGAVAVSLLGSSVAVPCRAEARPQVPATRAVMTPALWGRGVAPASRGLLLRRPTVEGLSVAVRRLGLPRGAAVRVVRRCAAGRRGVVRRSVVVVRHRVAGRSVVRRTVVAPGLGRRASGPVGSVVVRYALAQVGSAYVRGAAGGGAYDCSGLTMRAYALAGLRLPHSAQGQAAMARPVSYGRARAGDLVVGAGHVGVYLGGGMMVDAGNRRVGVVRRHLWAGLQLRRFV